MPLWLERAGRGRHIFLLSSDCSKADQGTDPKTEVLQSAASRIGGKSSLSHVKLDPPAILSSITTPEKRMEV